MLKSHVAVNVQRRLHVQLLQRTCNECLRLHVRLRQRVHQRTASKTSYAVQVRSVRLKAHRAARQRLPTPRLRLAFATT